MASIETLRDETSAGETQHAVAGCNRHLPHSGGCVVSKVNGDHELLPSEITTLCGPALMIPVSPIIEAATRISLQSFPAETSLKVTALFEIVHRLT